MAYYGNQPIAGENNSFKVLDDISSYTLTFDGSASTVVSASDDTLTFYDHRFIQGQRVTYTHGGGAVINGLTNSTAYYVIYQDKDTIKLATDSTNATNGTAIDISLSGTSGSSHTLNIAFDGTNTKFKATCDGESVGLTRPGQLMLAINNVIQEPQDSVTPSNGFAITNNSVILWSTAPDVNDTFWGHYLTTNLSSWDVTDNKVDSFTGDGSTTGFTLSKTPLSNKDILVTIDGVVQYPSDTTVRAYSVSAAVITFTSAPVGGADIQVRHIGFVGSSGGGGGGGGTSGVTAFYGRTGNVTVINTDNIIPKDVRAAGNLSVTGISTFTGDIDANADIELAGNLAVTGVSTFTGDAKFSGDLDIVGNLNYTTITDIQATGIITASKGIQIEADGLNVEAGISTFAGDIDANADIELAGNIAVTGVSTFTGDIDANADIELAGNIAVTGVSTFTGDIDANADIEVAGNLNVTGFSTLTGLLVQGGSAAKPTFRHSAGWGALRVAGSAGGSGSGFIFANNYSGTIEEKWSIYLDGSSDDLRFTAGPPETTANERVRITSAGKIGVNTTANLNAGAMTLYSANAGEGTATGQLELKDNAAFGSTPTGGIIFSGHHAAGSQAIFGGIRGFKANTGDGDYDGCLAFDVRKHGAVAYEAMRINEDGNVGINEDTPTSLLHIVDDNTASTPFIHLKGANDKACIRLENTADNPDNIWEILPSISGVSNTGFTIRDVTDSANRLVIDGSGKVGIGSAVPRGTIDVWGDGSAAPIIRLGTEVYQTEGEAIRFGRTDIGADDIRYHSITSFHDATAGANYLKFKLHNGSTTTSQATVLTLLGSGRVGIGSEIPVSPFDVANGTTAISFNRTNNTPEIHFRSNNVDECGEIRVGESSGGGVMDLKTKTTGGTLTTRLSLATDGDVIACNSSGNLGVGDRTTSPDEKLHVHTSSGEVTIHAEGATHANLNLRSHNGDSTIKFSDASASNVGNINYDHGTDSLAFRANSDERVRIDSSGRLTVGPEVTSNRTSYRTQLSADDANVLSLQVPSNTDGTDIQMSFWARNTNNAAIEIARIIAQAEETQANSTQKGHLRIGVNSGASIVERVRITPGGNIGLNGLNPSSDTVAIQEPSGGDPASVSITHLSGGNRYGAELRTITGTNEGLKIYTRFNSTNSERLTIKNVTPHVQVHGNLSVNNFSIWDAGFTGTWDTGISVNASNAGACMIFMCCRNWDANDSTHAGVYLVRLGYSGGQEPGVTHISGNNSWTIDRNTSNDTVQINGGSGNQRVAILWTT